MFENIAEMQANIETLYINGLKGRMLRLSASKKRAEKNEILMIYGHHASIERMYGLAEVLADYGRVTMPDLPGFGGMDSFYTIGMEPTLDNLADYLATFIKLRYRNKKVTIIGMSLGFAIVTRMLQKYPDIVNKVTILVSLVGFTRYDDTILSKNRVRLYAALAHTFNKKIPSLFFYNVVLHPSLIRAVYGKTPNGRKKIEHLSKQDQKKSLDFEVILWRQNDVRTYMEMILVMIKLDNCHKQIDLPVHHIAVEGDQYFDNAVVEQHMRVIFNDYIEHKTVLPNHAPSIVASREDADPFIPKSIKKVFEKTEVDS